LLLFVLIYSAKFRCFFILRIELGQEINNRIWIVNQYAFVLKFW